ncbi:hypothetical protein BWQ96_01792 [Gracilariopsis chorda]|uniref:Uncharacterized protein n=1 Tax=Gracilariopsis chorda TaxID=448386 RepID=A0A2V3J2J6_9FLOR|nr:hypothetical protein BWQ96_01792 [Gracilariopsis chorda]|eukprot:PXF48332.1 hypothetical protein BWQ96_01792 [Gracilariopsis chorda]
MQNVESAFSHSESVLTAVQILSGLSQVQSISNQTAMHSRTAYLCVYVGAFLLLLGLGKMMHGGQLHSETTTTRSKPTQEDFSKHAVAPVSRGAAINAFNPLIRTSSVPDFGFLDRITTWLRSVFPSHSSKEGNSQDKSVHLSSDPLEASFHSTRIGNLDIAYSNPYSTRKLQGVALLIHGCSQQAEDWFILPEHKLISSELLRQRFALLALTSQNRVTGCWSTRFPGRENEDVVQAKATVRQWWTKHRIPSSLPLIAVGISSGANMLSVLAHEIPIVSQALYISPGNQRALRSATENYPCTLFVHLATDRFYAPPKAIAAARRTLVRRNVALVGELPLPLVPFTSTTFHEHEPRFTKEISRRIYEAARKNGNKIMDVLREDELSQSAMHRSALQIARVIRGSNEISGLHADIVARWLASKCVKHSETH